jgi:hypothetical protein
MKKPKLEKLIQEIAMFDMAAAFTLHCRKDNEEYRDKDDLAEVMGWSDTPEGYKHWDIIFYKLQARRNNYHPHRDLMIEYANDKTIEIEYLRVVDGSWIKYREPAFYQDVKYRKKPNVTKKTIECRIYLDTHGEINIVERDAESNISHFKEWLGDWQKVEVEVEEND